MKVHTKSSSQLTKFAVVGAGHMGGHHIKKIRDIGPQIGAQLSVIVEPDELRALSYAREFPESQRPQVVSNLGMLSKLHSEHKPDAAVIAVPASMHVEATLVCLEQGLNCLVEKPLGFSRLDVEDISLRAKKANKHVQVGFLERWSLCNLWGDWTPQQGPWTVNSVRCGPFVPRAADADVIHDLMIHDLDLFMLLHSFFKLSKITKVQAWGRKLRSQLLDFAVMDLCMEDGGTARFFASRLSAEAARSWELTGSNWHATVDFMRRSMKRFEKVGRDMNAFQATENYWTGGDPLGLELTTFVKKIRGESLETGFPADARLVLADPDKLIPTPETVKKCHEIIDEALSSIKILNS